MKEDWKDWFLVVASFAGALLAGTALAQSPPPNAYNGFHLEGTIVSSALQPFKVPGPPGAGEEAVCLLRVQPYFHVHLPEHPEVDVWVQGSGVVHCLEWGEERRGDLVTVEGYLAVVEIEGEGRVVAKPLEMSISEAP